MKTNFKTILIIFLVALLGSSAGIFGVIEIMNKNGSNITFNKTRLNISEVTYTDIPKNDYGLVVDKTLDTVVEIYCNNQPQYSYIQTSSAGSGVVISEDGFIVTNNHVVDTAIEVQVKLYDGSFHKAEIIGKDSRSDIALIKIDSKDLAFASFANSDQIYLGQSVIAIGNPLGEGTSVTEGIISALAKDIVINQVSMELLQTSAAVNEGNSGGGLFDMSGNIVGIVNSKSSSSSFETSVEGMGYAIPSNVAVKIITDLQDYGFVRDRATLGIKVYTNTSSFYYSRISGCQVGEVVEGGAAEKAGIKVGDYITAINEYKITNYTDLASVLDRYNVGDEVEVTVYRNNNNLTVKATLQEATE